MIGTKLEYRGIAGQGGVLLGRKVALCLIFSLFTSYHRSWPYFLRLSWWKLNSIFISLHCFVVPAFFSIFFIGSSSSMS